MSTLTYSDTAWTTSEAISFNQQDSVCTFYTANKLNNKNIVLPIHIPGIRIPTDSTEASFYIEIGGKTYVFSTDTDNNITMTEDTYYLTNNDSAIIYGDIELVFYPY